MHVILMMAVTADGLIAKNDHHFPDWTSREDKEYFAKITKESGVVIMGGKTYSTLPGPLPGRLNVVFTEEKNPPKIKGVKWVSGELEPVLRELEEMGHKSAILGGGTFLNTLFLKKKLINEMILTIEPRLFGRGLTLFGKDFDIELKLLDVKKINKNTIMLKYKVDY